MQTQPHSSDVHPASAARSLDELEPIVIMTRLHLYNRGLPCGATALRRHLCEHDDVRPLPSARRIGLWLTRHGLTHARTGWYAGE